MTTAQTTPQAPSGVDPNDILVTVSMTQRDLLRLRVMIERDEEQETIMKWLKWILFVGVATIGSTVATAVTWWDSVKSFFAKIGG
jgi:hypothetical protein